MHLKPDRDVTRATDVRQLHILTRLSEVLAVSRITRAGSMFDGSRGRSDRRGRSCSDQAAKAVNLNVRGIEMLSGHIPAVVSLTENNEIRLI